MKLHVGSRGGGKVRKSSYRTWHSRHLRSCTGVEQAGVVEKCLCVQRICGIGQNVNRTYLWVMGSDVPLISLFVCIFKKTYLSYSLFVINKSYLQKVTIGQAVQCFTSMNK